ARRKSNAGFVAASRSHSFSSRSGSTGIKRIISALLLCDICQQYISGPVPSQAGGQECQGQSKRWKPASLAGLLSFSIPPAMVGGARLVALPLPPGRRAHLLRASAGAGLSIIDELSERLRAVSFQVEAIGPAGRGIVPDTPQIGDTKFCAPEIRPQKRG